MHLPLPSCLSTDCQRNVEVTASTFYPIIITKVLIAVLLRPGSLSSADFAGPKYLTQNPPGTNLEGTEFHSRMLGDLFEHDTSGDENGGQDIDRAR